MDYNEFDDYGMDSAEGGKEYDEMVDTATRLLIEEAAEAEERGGASMGREIGLLLKK
jgi:hypothetical protein